VTTGEDTARRTGGPTGERPRPLAGWRYRGTLRTYQRDVLDRVPVDPGDPVHVVAPPGAGKTLLGLLLAARHGGRALVLAPTATIRAQWARSAADLHGDATVSEDPEQPGDLTALTYQMLSVLDTGDPLTDLATADWRRELVAGGRDADAAARWVEDLRTTNESAFRAGVRRRSRAIRKRLAREDPELLAEALHPNARALVDRLVTHGVETVVLDECHHLLDHWALVVGYLLGRIRAAGREPVVIGLTATLPSTDDRDAHDNYTALLGDVDYEVPTPAVVKEGNLAPYRDHVWFVEPTADELAFLRDHERRLAALIGGALAEPDGIDWLESTLQPGSGSPEERLAAAFAADFAVAESAARMLAEFRADHPLLALLPEDVRRAPDAEQRIRVLARYALDRLLPDPARAEQWQRIKHSIVDFGFTLTDRGVRRSRDPIDTVLASSAAKDRAVVDLLHLELSQDAADRVRTVVVTDHATHGNARGSAVPAAGALRTFRAVATEDFGVPVRPVLVTAQHLRIAARDAGVLLPSLERRLGTTCTPGAVPDDDRVLSIETPGAGSAAVLAAVSALLTDGTTRLVVGTRGLLGEGWDCPAANTLVDLTAVATSSATQQLRGRTLRLDPAWPRKVAHNWTVTAVVPADVPLDAAPDVSRMRRKHEQIWGLLRADATQVVRGTGIALTDGQARRVAGLVAKDRRETVGALDGTIAAELPSRADSWAAWRIGEPYADRESTAAVVEAPRTQPFRTGPTAEFVLTVVLGAVLWLLAESARGIVALWRLGSVPGVLALCVVIGLAVVLVWPVARQLGVALRQRFSTVGAYRRAVRVVIDALHRAGRIPAFGEGDVRVTAQMSGRVPERFTMEVLGARPEDRRLVTDALAEFFGPVRTPRFLLQVGRTEAATIRRQPLLVVALWVARAFTRGDRYFAVPTAVGRRRADAEAFAADWTRTLGPCRLHEIGSPESLVLLVRARRTSGAATVPPVLRDQWS
jgi:superfamily II DNA or RNA helicase